MTEARKAQRTRACAFCSKKMYSYDKGTYCSRHRGKKFTDWLKARYRGSATRMPSDESAQPGAIHPPTVQATTTASSIHPAIKTDLPLPVSQTVPVDPQRIITRVVDTCTVTHQGLAGPGSTRHVAQPRMLAMYLLRRHCAMSAEDVGMRFNRDPGAVDMAVVMVSEAIRNRLPWATRPIRHIEEQLDIPRERRSL